MAYELGMVDPSAQSPGASRLGRVLGDLLGGAVVGNNREPGQAYYDQLGQNYTIQKKKSESERAFEEASISRTMSISRDSITPELLARWRAGDAQAEAAIGAAVLRSAETPNMRNYTGGALDMQELGFRDAAVHAGRKELGDMNGNLAGIKGVPLEVNKVTANGQQYDPYVAGGSVTLTPLGRVNEDLIQARTSSTSALGSKYQSDANSNRIKAERGPAVRGGGRSGGNSMSAADHKINFKSLADTYGATINSQWRTSKRNAEVGGVKNSQHLIGTAGDFSVPDDQKEAFISQARDIGYEVIDEGDHVHLEEPPAGMGKAHVNKKVPEFSQAYALQALDDARKAIAAGLITKEAARKRLIDAGMKLTAGRL